ncbi:amidohydrolase [Cellulomonas chengniuliangii]|uniref:amidohydrolase n=1 Tax=Cellulomonas chengniuliangii TaxID=2968084 RepID=UPI001D0E30DA|nr:amidohydrolase family protein [Cellulomonas chengniuliangii]MCC2317476.1 amidohydrolase family protein [Cellulomonas chengniuliangii]
MTSTLYRHGVVHSPADPFAEALLVEDGVVAWIGADDTADGIARRADEVVDLDGALVAPGFVDAHAHLLETGFALDGVALDRAAGVRSLADALAAVHDAAQRLRGGEPLLGHGWDEQAWPEGRAPRLDELDQAAGGAPVYLARVDAHSAVVSSSFADAAGLRGLPGWSDDGRVEREAHHAARALARDVSPERRDELTLRAMRAAAAAGIVSIHEQSAPFIDTREGLARLIAMTAEPSSGLPHVVGYRGELCVTSDDAHELAAAIPGLTGIGGDLSVDGSLGSRTAALRAPYADVLPGSEHANGVLHLSAEQICNHLGSVTRAGLQGGFHVIGDRAMDELMIGLRAAVDVEGVDAIRGAGHRVEHAEMIDAHALATLVLLGVRLSVQPAFDAAWGGPDGMYAARLGAGRAAGLNPLADLAAAGVPLAFGSDAPVTPFDPWGAVRAAITHHAVDQRISARAAFRAHTRGGWRAAGLEHTGAGEIRVGSPAHLAIWRAEHLAVQGADGRMSAWSTDVRAGTPLLPVLEPGSPSPTCLRTVRGGVVLHDALG